MKTIRLLTIVALIGVSLSAAAQTANMQDRGLWGSIAAPNGGGDIY